MKAIPVLISGAGPTGLMAACQLAIRDIPFRIIDKSHYASSKTKALVVQARSLEIFNQLGIIEPFMNAMKVDKIQLFSRGKLRQEIPLGSFNGANTPFPFLAFIGQDKTEKFMIDFLKTKNIIPEWGTELIDLQQTKEKATAIIRTSKGIDETVTADWVIGADGSHSKVRHSMNVKFEGAKYPHGFMLSDVDIDWGLEENTMKFLISNKSFAIFFPLGKKHYRIISLVPESMEDIENPDFEDLKNYIENEFHFSLTINNPRWTSFYSVHHRCVDQFREGRFLLAGDAAHIHSPAGGQGMNTGLQDAYNLCWKLGMVIKGEAGESLLDTYQKERLPIAEHLVYGTDRLFSVMINSNPVWQFIRARILPRMMGLGLNGLGLRKQIFKFVSQTGINYEKRYPHFNFSKKIAIKAGSRFPNFPLEGMKKETHELLNGIGFHLLCFMDEVDEKKIEEFVKRFPTEISVHQISSDNKNIYKEMKIEEDLFLLIRPDMHVGIVCDNLGDLEKYKRSTHFLLDSV